MFCVQGKFNFFVSGRGESLPPLPLATRLDDDITHTSVSGNCTWQRKGFSSQVSTAVLVKNGNVFDVELIPQCCKGHNLKNNFKLKNQQHILNVKMHIFVDTIIKVRQTLWKLRVHHVFLRGSVNKRKLRLVEVLGRWGYKKLYKC